MPLERPRPHPAAAAIRLALLDWYAEARRDLPWRRTRDPYAIWVSEVMLQQTQVVTVIGYFERWMARFPTLEALAGAEEAEVLRSWEGLGYYSRARALLGGARAVRDRHGGVMPKDAQTLRELPGVGPYTAGAIASIAFGRDEPVVDGNVRRVLCRLFELRGDPGRAPLAAELWTRARALLPRGRAGDFNQALMELGARICTPRRPRCGECPLAACCAAHRRGVEVELPERGARAPTTALEQVAAVCKRRGRVLVLEIPRDAARWGGLWQFPTVELRAGEAIEGAAERAALELSGLEVAAEERIGVILHAVTRYRIRLTAVRCRVVLSVNAVARRGRWLPPGALDAIAMPAAQRKIAGWVGAGAPLSARDIRSSRG